MSIIYCFLTQIFDRIFNVVDTFRSLIETFPEVSIWLLSKAAKENEDWLREKHIICLRFTIEQQKYTNKTCRCSLASDHFNSGFRDCS